MLWVWWTDALAVVALTAYAVNLLASVAYRRDLLTLLLSAIRSPLAVFEARAAPFYTAGDADYAAITRALGTGRIMLLSCDSAADGVSVKALGECGAVYELRFGRVPACSCPAFMFKRTAQCKHLAWFKTKVLGVPPNHYLVTQTAYLRLEHEYMLRTLGHAAHTQLYAPRPILEALGVVAATATGDDAVCAICYDELDAAATASAMRCAAQCRKPFHPQCVTDYHTSLKGDGKPPICPYCRSPWVDNIAVQTVLLRTNALTQQVSHPQGPTPKKRRASVKN